MAKETPTTKICKFCQTEIPYAAKICPQCRKKVKGGKLKWIIIAVVAVLIIASATSGSKKPTNDPQKLGTVDQDTSSTNLPTQTEQPTEEAKTVYRVGDILQDGHLEIVYMSSGEYTSDNMFTQPADGNKYIFVQLAFENTSTTEDASVSTYHFACYADGYSASMFYGGEEDLSATLSAGRSTSGYLYFEVPQNASDIQIEYETNVFTNKKITFIYEGEKDSGYVLKGNAAPTEGALRVGDRAESKSLNITYLSCFADESNNMFIQAKDGYHYVTCEFEFENVSSSDHSVSAFSFDCYADGIDCDMAFFRDDAISATMSAGRKAKGTVTFEVPNYAQVVEVEYLSNFWTSNRVVFAVEEP